MVIYREVGTKKSPIVRRSASAIHCQRIRSNTALLIVLVLATRDSATIIQILTASTNLASVMITALEMITRQQRIRSAVHTILSFDLHAMIQREIRINTFPIVNGSASAIYRRRMRSDIALVIVLVLVIKDPSARI